MPVTRRPWTTVEGGPAAPRGSTTSPWNGPCTDNSPVRWWCRALAGCAIASAAAGCDRRDDRIEDIVARRTSSAVLSQSNLAFTFDVFRTVDDIAELDLESARMRAVDGLVGRVRGANLHCEPEIATDGRSIVTARFMGCRAGLLRLEGEITARLEILARECRSGECPAMVQWTIEDFDVELGPELANPPQLSGPLVLRDPIEPDGPMTWDTADGFALENAWGVFDTRSHASWSIDAEGCMDFELQTRLTQLERDESIDLEIGEIVVQADDVHRCPAVCPARGRLRLSYGRGDLLEWDYAERDDDDEVDVIAPRGHQFRHRLACL